jgi:hypothetical protein
MLFVFDDIRDRLTNRHFLFLNRSLKQGCQNVTKLLDFEMEVLIETLRENT